MEKDQVFKQIFLKLKNAKNVLFVCHKHPDFDTVGSACAMALLAERLDVKFSLFCFDYLIESFLFLPLANKFVSQKTINLADFDVIITLDCGDLKRTGIADELIAIRKDFFMIDIDHHHGGDQFADLQVKDPNAKATALLVYDFFKVNNLTLTRLEAECLLTGILFDTGNFSFPNVAVETYNLASELCRLGASWSRVNQNLFKVSNVNALKAFGKTLLRAKFDEDHKSISSFVKAEEIDCLIAEIEGVPNFLASFREASFSLFLREDGNVVRASLRTMKNDVDVLVLANKMGGGGHKKASGFIVSGVIQEQGNRFSIV